MSRTQDQQVFSLDELSSKAKENARNWYREHISLEEWWDTDYEDFDAIAKILGIDINRDKHGLDISFRLYVQGSGASFDGDYHYAKGSVKAIKDYAPQDTTLHTIAETLQDLQRRNFYKLSASVKQGRDVHSRDTTINVYKDGSEWDIPEGVEEELSQALRDFMDWMYERILDASDAINSDEVIDENIEANVYEFDVDGNRVYSADRR